MDLKDFQTKSSAILEGLKKELFGLRGNRPTSRMVEDIKADYFGQLLPIKQMASISVAPPREIDVRAWDKNAAAAIAKAIEASDLGLTVNVDGALIRLNLPPLSEERRQEIIKLAKKIAEEHRIQLRHLRDETNKEVHKAEEENEVSEDQKFKLKEDIQKNVDKINEEIEKILDNKIKEIKE